MKLPFAITRKSILILVIVCLCGVVHYETIPPHELYPDTLNMIEAGGLNDSTIVYRIVEQELAFHKSKRLLVEGKIFDYKNIFIIPEENPEDPEEKRFRVTYSVQTRDDYWKSDNGEPWEDDWILNKYTYVRLEKTLRDTASSISAQSHRKNLPSHMREQVLIMLPYRNASY